MQATSRREEAQSRQGERRVLGQTISVLIVQNSLEQPTLPPSPQSKDSGSAIVSTLGSVRITHNCGKDPVDGYDPCGEGDTHAEEWGGNKV